MRLLVYALRFQGWATVKGVDGNVLRTSTRASSGMLSSLIGRDGMAGSFKPEPDGEAWQASQLTFTGTSTFQAVGTVTFGTGVHRLRFHTVGSGYLDPVSHDGCRHGAAMFWIDGGDGQFSGANGLITSNFLKADIGEVIDYQLGVVLVPETEPQPEIPEIA